MAIPRFWLPLLVSATLWLLGCAAPGAVETPSESAIASKHSLVESRTDSQIRRAAWAEKFRKDRARCHNAGKRIVVMASRSPDRKGIPARGDRYFCQ